MNAVGVQEQAEMGDEDDPQGIVQATKIWPCRQMVHG